MSVALSISTTTSASKFIASPLRISTMTVTANWGTQINLDKLFEQLKDYFIPIWYPDDGILKFEHKKAIMGASYKDIFTNCKVTSKSFFNQSTIVLRRRVDSGWKEVNMKLFANGGIQMTGVVSEDFAVECVHWLLNIIRQLPESPFKEEPRVQKVTVPLINTDYSIDHEIQQDALHRILVEEYNLFSMLEKTIYQGINTKFFYNTNNSGNGICMCEKSCKGQGNGNGEGECKRITMSIFRTGKIIITGARKMEQIETAYNFLNNILKKHYSKVLIKSKA
jgi:TATA-box binding protein (TBP) (component of TFIID and TFIIIB)